MKEAHLSATLRRSNPRCRRCGRFKGVIYTALCHGCVEQTLKQRLPRLKRILEERYGRQLDEWLDDASFTDVRWDTSINFTVGERLFQCFLAQLIQEAAENKDIWLDFSDNVSWTPTQFSQLLNFINQTHGTELRQLIAQRVTAAIRSAPTGQAERELVALVGGKLQPQRIEVLDEAVACLADTKSSGLPYGARTLIELRYKLNKYVSLYTEVDEGFIDPVWKEMAEELPKSVQKLLPED
jgi:hypothetical protein